VKPGAAAAAGRDLGAVTLTIPLASLGPLGPIQLAPPALVSSTTGAEHVGMTPADLREHLGWMARSPRWRGSVIEVSRKRRLAAPADVIGSLRERYAGEPAGEPPESGVDAVLALAGCERVSSRGRR